MCGCGKYACPSCGPVRLWSSRQPPPPPGPPPEPAGDAGQGGLTVRELGYLRLAGSWGLLRHQSRRRFMLTGEFSMSCGDLTRLLEAAGGTVYADADIEGGEVDVLVRGDGASVPVVELAIDCQVLIWDEADLVLELLPLPGQLQAKPGEPFF